MRLSRYFPKYGNSSKERADKLEAYAATLFTPAEMAVLASLTENVDIKYRLSWRCDLLYWACEARVTSEKTNLKYLGGIFKGIVIMTGVYEPTGLPRLAVISGREGEL